MTSLQGSTLSVIGAGVMAEAIIAGVLERKLLVPGSVVASHPRADRRHALGEKYGIHVTADNADAARRGDVVVLGIKPQVMPSVLTELHGSLGPNKLVISIIAGATTQTLRKGLDHGALVRVMPNTPAQIGEGVNIWYATPETTPAQVHLGFPRQLAHDLVLETIKGSVAFAERTQKHPAQLRDMVTSPGGTSAAALHELERGRLRTVLADAVWAAYRRTMSLSDSLSAGKDPEPMPPRNDS